MSELRQGPRVFVMEMFGGPQCGTVIRDQFEWQPPPLIEMDDRPAHLGGWIGVSRYVRAFRRSDGTFIYRYENLGRR